MPRFILIDSNSGYVFGDSADIAGQIVNGTPCEVARALDASLGSEGTGYTEMGTSAVRSGLSGYLVYRADIDGSEAVPVVQDGQDADTIAEVERLCDLDCFVAVERASVPYYA